MVMDLILIPSKLVDIPKICRFMEEFLVCNFIEFSLSAWVISCKFAAFLQNIFSEQYPWRAVYGNLLYNKKQGKQRYID